MTNTQDRLAAIFAAADRAGLPVEVKQGIWQHLAAVGTRQGRDQLLTRWEQTAETWPSTPVTARQVDAMRRAEFVV